MNKEYDNLIPPNTSTRVCFENFDSFYAEYYKIVLGYLIKKTNSFADAEDVAEKVFLYCYEKWETYDPSKATQATWLFMVVRSRWTDFLRTNKKFVNIDELDEKLAGVKEMTDAKMLEMSEGVHRECVKVYRNVQAVVVEENTKQQEQMEDAFSRQNDAIKKAFIVAALAAGCSAVTLVIQILSMLNVF